MDKRLQQIISKVSLYTENQTTYKALSAVNEALILLEASKKHSKIVVIKETMAQASELTENLLSLIDENEILMFPNDENAHYDLVAESRDLLVTRIDTLHKIQKNKSFILVLSTCGLCKKIDSPQIFNGYCLNIAIGDEIPPHKIIDYLTNTGYTRVHKVDSHFQFAIRGAVIDIFSVNSKNPIRIVFDGDTVAYLRYFDIASQLTVENIQEYSFLPSFDTKDGDSYSVLDYIDKFALFVSNYDNCLDFYNFLYNEFTTNDNNSLTSFPFANPKKVLSNRKYTSFISEPDGIERIKSVDPINNNIPLLKKVILDSKKKILFCLDNKIQSDYLKTQFPDLEEGIHDIGYIYYTLYKGFQIDDFIIYSSNDIFAKGQKKVHSKYKSSHILSSYANLVIGDYIVHESYGIGKYLGIKTLNDNNISRDFLYIEYANDDHLYLPTENFSVIRKYVGKEGLGVKLSSLNTNTWEKTKARIKKDLEDISEQLMKTYEERLSRTGFSFEFVKEYENNFALGFPFELTDDQVATYEEIKEDMQRAYPMDRLLCGDVAFGKTEVAFKCAYSAILNNKQVAILCPTTLLSRQHYENALIRFKGYEVRICVLNRFNLMKHKQILSDIQNHKYDLIIGTHRLLSNDVVFADIGLLIIDEEQRFGVLHKEKIKQIKTNVDVLTLTATPIPRTLQMSLIGIRSFSKIETPPQNRLPIQTYVMRKSDKIIKDVIERELGRLGQVFVLHNNISTIEELRRKIKNLIPFAKIGIVHGQMNRDDIEEVMISFYSQTINVLISTTIIENGIDVPNANTIIIDRANTFGLAQLYQIRGRVGRSDRLGYAYLLIDEEKVLTEEAQKRLDTLKEFTELGSGYDISMRDLAIRGAGDLLGQEQAGFIETVGMDLYLKLLEEALAEKKGEVIQKEEIVSKNISINAYLPDQFQQIEGEKFSFYQKIDETKSLEDVYNFETVILDTYGYIPSEVQNIIDKRKVNILLSSLGVEELKDNGIYIIVTFPAHFSQKNRFYTTLIEISRRIFDLNLVSVKNVSIILQIPKKNGFLTKLISLLIELQNIV